MLTVRNRNRNKNPKDGRIAMPGEHDRHTSYSYVSVVINRPVPNAYINTHERGNCFFFCWPARNLHPLPGYCVLQFQQLLKLKNQTRKNNRIGNCFDGANFIAVERSYFARILTGAANMNFQNMMAIIGVVMHTGSGGRAANTQTQSNRAVMSYSSRRRCCCCGH